MPATTAPSTASRLSRKTGVATDTVTAGSPIGRSVKVWKKSRVRIMNALWPSSTTTRAAVRSVKLMVNPIAV